MHKITVVCRSWTNYYKDLTKLPQLPKWPKELNQCLSDKATESEQNKVGCVACIAGLLRWIASYHTGVASTVSTSACPPCCTLNRWQCTDTYQVPTMLWPDYMLNNTEEDTARFGITNMWAVYRADVFSGQRHHALACGSFWVWWRLHLMRLLLKGASQPLIGLSLFIPPRDESDPNRLWSGGEMGLPPGP